jgi:predicted dehydrogenase
VSTPDGALGVACLGVTHPHTSARAKTMMEMPGVRVVGAADDHPVIVPFTEALGIPRRGVGELLADPDVSAVLIHSKSDEMVDLSVAALESGKAVLVEKPAGRGLADLDRLAEAVERTGGLCQVGYNFRFSPAVEVTQAALAEGWLGTVIQARLHGACSLDEAATSHLNQPGDMGGALFVIGCHVIDLMLHHFGVPDSVNALVPKLPAAIPGDYREDAVGAVFRYPDRLVTVDFSSWDPLPWCETWQVDVYGTEGVLHAGPLPGRYEIYLSSPHREYPAGWTRWQETSFPVPWAATPTAYSPELAEIANMSFFRREASAFLSAVRKQSDIAITAAHARDIVRCVAACYESSASSGTEVRIAR